MKVLMLLFLILSFSLAGMDNSSVFEVIRRDDGSALNELFRQGISPFALDKEGNSLLHLAARCNAVACVRVIFDCAGYKLDAELKNKEGDTPLHIAARYNAVDFTRRLFERRRAIFVNIRNKYFETPLSIGVDAHAIEFVKVLFELWGFVPVDQRASENQLKIDTNVRNKFNGGGTPLHVAIAHNDLDMVQLLLEHGANPNVDVHLADAAYTMLPPLHVAAAHNVPHIAVELISRGARVDMVDYRGDTSLHIAAQYNADAVVRVLLANGAVRDVRDRDGKIPLERASAFGSDRVIELLGFALEFDRGHTVQSLLAMASLVLVSRVSNAQYRAY